nr:hypothetical protein GCM10017611_32580 [Rhodococcus wratislaviensis]
MEIVADIRGSRGAVDLRATGIVGGDVIHERPFLTVKFASSALAWRRPRNDEPPDVGAGTTQSTAVR